MQKTGRAWLALAVFGDAVERIFNGYYTGTPQEHVDRINELFGRRPPRNRRADDLITLDGLDDDGLSYVGEPSEVKADAQDRSAVLLAASGLTSVQGDADAVLANAEPLLAWVEAAGSREDMDLRVRSLVKQWGIDGRADDDPGRFLAEAVKLYAFLTAEAEA